MILRLKDTFIEAFVDADFCQSGRSLKTQAMRQSQDFGLTYIMASGRRTNMTNTHKLFTILPYSKYRHVP